MAVRRLAPKELQPANFTFSAENLAWAKQQIAKYPEGRQASAVIPILWRVQEQHDGWVSEAAIRAVADLLDMPYIRALEIATFYTMFQLQPVGKKAHVQVCGTTPCRLRGASDIIEVCQSRIHHEPFHLSKDGNFSWEEVECLMGGGLWRMRRRPRLYTVQTVILQEASSHARRQGPYLPQPLRAP